MQLNKLSRLYLKAQLPKKAWSTTKEAHQYLKQNKNWRKIGLGRFILEITFEIIIKINNPNHKIAQEAFKIASKEIKGMKNLYINLLKIIIKSGKIMGDKKLVKTFSKTLKKEQKELDKILA